MAASISALLDSLPNTDDKTAVLDDLKTALGSLPPSAVGNVVANASFTGVFDCLSTNNRDELELACDVIQKLFTPLPLDVMLSNFQTDLLTGLTHSEVAVRKLCVTQVKRIAEESPLEMSQYNSLVDQVIQLLGDNSTDIAQTAEQTIVALADVSEGLDVVYTGRCLESLQRVLSASDVIRVRAYDTIVKISQKSINNLQRSAEIGVLQQFINELHKDDILLQLNCLELLSDLAFVEHGLTYLDQQGVVTKLEGMLQASESDPLSGFLIPGLIKFFGSVARLHPKEVLTNNTVFVTTVLNNLSSPETVPLQSLAIQTVGFIGHTVEGKMALEKLGTSKQGLVWERVILNNLSSPETVPLQSLAIQTVGFIGHTIEGKMALEKLGTRIDNGVRCLGKALREGQQGTKVQVLQALDSLLSVKVSEQTSELLKLTEHWYAHLGNRTFDYIMQLVEQPFPDLRSAVHGFMQALALQPWGQRIMNEQPGFKEYLLDRSTEKTKEGKEGKYDIVTTLANSPTVVETFGQPYVVQLKVYCSQGPFYVRVQAEVAMEGDS